MATGVAAGNLIAESTISDPADAYDVLVDLGTRLDESDVPTEGRFAIVTPKFHGFLQKDSRFIATGDAAAVGTRANGRVGEAAGFSIRKSNNPPTAPAPAQASSSSPAPRSPPPTRSRSTTPKRHARRRASRTS